VGAFDRQVRAHEIPTERSEFNDGARDRHDRPGRVAQHVARLITELSGVRLDLGGHDSRDDADFSRGHQAAPHGCG
jgi:hypothetical protein